MVLRPVSLAQHPPAEEARRVVHGLLPTGSMKLGAQLIAALVALGALPAGAQTTPTVMATPVSVSTNLLTPAQRAEVDNNREAREYTLSWAITNPGNRRFRISFDRDDIRSTPQQLVPEIGATDAEGSAAGSTTSIIVSEDALLDRIQSDPDTFGQEGDLTIHLLVFTTDDTPGEDSDVFRDSWVFQYDFQAPDGPPLVLATPGERAVQVQWTTPSANDIQFFEVQYCPSVAEDLIRSLTLGTASSGLVTNTSTNAYRLLMLPCTSETGLVTRENIQETEDQITLTDGIEEGGWIAFTLLAVDESPFLNVTETSTVYAVRTEAAIDFFERQRELGGGEDGGFCFVATAAHGSYAHPVVGALRAFRDQVLGRLPGGRVLTRTYYDLSPPLAAALDAHPILAAWARYVLLAAVLLGGAAGLFLIWVCAGWTLRRTRVRAILAVLVAGLGLGFAANAHAQVRGDASGAVGFGFEAKAGPYLPAIAEVVDDGGLQAWEDIYGGGRTRVLFNLGGELQFLRGDFGTLSLGGTVGFIAWEGNALTTDANGFLRPGVEGSSTFNIVPMTLTLGYKFDLLLDRTPVPLAPYVKGGVAYHIWWNTRDDGSLSSVVADTGETREAIGGRPGLVGTIGLAFALNGIDPVSAAQFQATTGIRTSYLFFEGQLSWVDGFGDNSNFDFSDITWFGGLMLEI